MFGIDSAEFLLIVIVAVVVIGPKDLPRALYKVGQVVGKAQAMARHFRTGIDAMVREVELEELEKKWAAQNARIMNEHRDDGVDAATAVIAAPDATPALPPPVVEAYPADKPAPLPASTAAVPAAAPPVPAAAADGTSAHEDVPAQPRDGAPA